MSYLCLYVNGIGRWSVDFQFWFTILCDLSYKRHCRTQIFILFSSNFIHFVYSVAVTHNENFQLDVFLCVRNKARFTFSWSLC